MKKVLLIVVSLLMASCAHMPTPVSQDRLNAYFQSTVIVRVRTTAVEDGVTVTVGWSGTGFSIQSNSGDEPGSVIMTNKHVCQAKGNGEYTLTDYTGKQYRAKFVRYAPHADLCLLETDAMIKPVKLADHDPKRGEHLVVVGAPRGDMPLFTDGYVSGYTAIDMYGDGFEVHVRALQTSVPIYPGSSGSPMFNDAGKVVGIMFAGRRDSEHITYAVPIEVIFQFLDTSNDVFSR